MSIGLKLGMLNLIFLFLIPLISAYSHDWNIQIDSRIDYNSNIATGQFIAGTKSSASDSLDSNDGRMIEAPSYSIPFYSIINSEYFMVDYKSDLLLDENKTWQITQKGSSEFRRAGTLEETVTWDISNISEEINLTLIDYGSDSSRTNIIKEINLREDEEYVFNVTRPYQDYRYFDIIATLIEDLNVDDESNNNGGNTNGGGGSNSRTQNEEKCTPSWKCTYWTTCLATGTQNRICNDETNCGTEEGKPNELQSCIYTLIEPKASIENIEYESLDEINSESDRKESLKSITGNVIGTNFKEPNIFVGNLIMISIVLIGLIVYWIITKRYNI